MKKISDFLLSILESFVIAIVIVFILFEFVIYPIEIDGSSMYPNLVNGQRGFSFILTRKFGIKRFDIVVIESGKNENKLVKRVIGMPGEYIEYNDNKLYINGEFIEEDFLDDDVVTNDFSYTLGPNEYFCLGDNREVSRDSRYYGSFKGDDIITTNVFIYMPISEAGLK